MYKMWQEQEVTLSFLFFFFNLTTCTLSNLRMTDTVNSGEDVKEFTQKKSNSQCWASNLFVPKDLV